MDVQALLEEARDTVRARVAYGEPFERNGVTVIPASAVRGGGGGGSDKDANSGGGFGLMARPAGAWVIRGEHVTWKPAVDPTRVVFGAELVAMAALLRRARRRRSTPEALIRGAVRARRYASHRHRKHGVRFR